MPYQLSLKESIHVRGTLWVGSVRAQDSLRLAHVLAICEVSTSQLQSYVSARWLFRGQRILNNYCALSS